MHNVWADGLAAFSILCGIVIAKYPRKAIDAQIRFYSRINWKMEPVSMEKELWNTRFMGVCLIGAGVAALLYTGLK